MADFYGDLANALVYPTELDHHGSGAEGIGSSVLEAYLCATMYGHAPWWGSVKSGFAVPTTGTGLAHNIAVGEAILLGHRIYGTGNVACDFTANAVNWVFLVMEYDASIRVIRPIITINTTGTKPANSILLGTVTFNTTPAITAYTDTRWMGHASWGMIASDGGYMNRGSYDWTASGYSPCTITTDYNTFHCALILVTPTSANYIQQGQRTGATTFTVDFTDHAGVTQSSNFNFLILT